MVAVLKLEVRVVSRDDSDLPDVRPGGDDGDYVPLGSPALCLESFGRGVLTVPGVVLLANSRILPGLTELQGYHLYLVFSASAYCQLQFRAGSQGASSPRLESKGMEVSWLTVSPLTSRLDLEPLTVLHVRVSPVTELSGAVQAGDSPGHFQHLHLHLR